MRTGAQYIEGLRKKKHVVWNLGKRLDNVVDYPVLRPMFDTIAATFDLALVPENEELLTATSHLTGERVNRFAHIFMSVDDLLKRQQEIRFVQGMMGSCVARCGTLGAINTLYGITYETDQKHGTNYHPRALEYLKHVEKEDLILSIPMMDNRGDRSKRPAEQADPDMFLRVVEERPNGIVVRGAKALQFGFGGDECVIFPCAPMREDEKQYAVIAAVEADAKGISYILDHGPTNAMNMTGTPMDCGNALFHGGFSPTALQIFDDVFIPKERVFMQGEWDMTQETVRRFGLMARMWQTGCRSGSMDLLTGAAALIAEYNGIARSPHVVDKLTQMVILTETVWGLALAGALTGKPTPSGQYLPDQLLINAGKYQAIQGYWELCKLASDLTGGIIVGVPAEADIRNPETGKWIDKFMRGVNDVPTEHRLRAVRLVQWLAQTTNIAGLHFSGGPMQNQKLVIYRVSDWEEKKRRAKVCCGIEKPDWKVPPKLPFASPS